VKDKRFDNRGHEFSLVTKGSVREIHFGVGVVVVLTQDESWSLMHALKYGGEGEAREEDPVRGDDGRFVSTKEER
jgi:hypothetical protein